MAFAANPTIVFCTSPSQKRTSKISALQYKNGSPTLRNMLRDKCRIRMKEARGSIFNQKRNLTDTDMNFVGFILRQEITELEEDITLQEMIVEELLREADQWVFETLVKEDEAIIQQFESATLTVFCPVCQKHILSESNFIINCICGLKFYCIAGLTVFQHNIQQKIDSHEQHCDSILQFFAEPSTLNFGFSTLHATCAKCEYFTSIIPN